MIRLPGLSRIGESWASLSRVAQYLLETPQRGSATFKNQFELETLEEEIISKSLVFSSHFMCVSLYGERIILPRFRYVATITKLRNTGT